MPVSLQFRCVLIARWKYSADPPFRISTNSSPKLILAAVVAGTAMRGEAGARMVVRLVSAKRKDGVLVAKLTADAESPSSGRHMHCKKDKYIIPLTDLKEIDWSARGGTGGAGGIGGDGGDGGKGRQGEDATREKPGMPGRRGGAGGDAGHGSDGRDGGNGGVVELRLKQRDAFLLMAVGTLLFCDGARSRRIVSVGRPLVS